MFSPIKSLIQTFPMHPYSNSVAIGLTLILFCLSVWVSIDDIKTKAIYVWKLLIVGLFTVSSVPLFGLATLQNWKFTAFMALAIPLYVLGIFLNIKFNHDKFVGKADVDMILSYICLGASFSLWQLFTANPMVKMINIPYIWSNILGSLLIGLLTGTVIFLLGYTYQVIRGRYTFALIRKTRIAALPMFVVPNVLVPLIMMTFIAA